MKEDTLGWAALTAILLVTILAAHADAQKAAPNPLQEAALGKLRPATIAVTAATATAAVPVIKPAPFFSSALLTAAEEAFKGAGRAAAAPVGPLAAPNPLISATSDGCSGRRTAGVTRVNQDCTFRRQAEEGIVINPANTRNLLAGMNDSRAGFNQCGFAFSTDRGVHWGDGIPPFRQKINNPEAEEPTARDPNRHTIAGGPGTLKTYDAASDPAVAFDTGGRGFFSCVIFDIFTPAAAVFVAQSPAGAEASFFRNISSFSRQFMVAEDNNPGVAHDKEFITVDTNAASPNRDNVYVTWTVFRFDPRCVDPTNNPGGFCSADIFGSMSTDHGLTFSTPEMISGASPAHCQFGNIFDPLRGANDCDLNQGSDLVALPNGDLVVVRLNFNTPTVNNQQLATVCHPSGSSPAGTAHLNCNAPTFVGDDVAAGEPQCDFGRGPEECVPGPFVRTNDFPRISANRRNGHLMVVWQDYRNREFDIQGSISTNGGVTWSQSATLNPDTGLDHHQAAVALSSISKSDRAGVSYYRSQRVPNENITPAGGFAPGQPGVGTSKSDYVLAGGSSLNAPYNFRVASPVFPAPDGIQAGFLGDYSGLAVNGTQAFPIWSDTSNADPFAPLNGVNRDEDVFTRALVLPSGVGRRGPGIIGR